MLSTEIKAFRKLKKLTQSEFGKLIGVSASAVTIWEQGGNIEKNKLPIIMGILEGKSPQLREQEVVYYTKGNSHFPDIGNKVEEIKSLFELKTLGSITEEEYLKLKTEIIER